MTAFKAAVHQMPSITQIKVAELGFKSTQFGFRICALNHYGTAPVYLVATTCQALC